MAEQQGQERRSSDGGAAMVELAIVLPLFLLLLFGIMEAGWLFAQQVEVRNAAREGGRLAVVDYPGPTLGDSAAIKAEVCTRTSIGADRASVGVIFSNNGTVSNSLDDTAIVTVTQQYMALTGFFPWSGTIDSTVEMRLERDAITWVDIDPPEPCSP